jgi:hypothetical protein
MATSDGTLLCLFTGTNCIIVDDFNQKVVHQSIPITTIWPALPHSMNSGVDAVCRDELNKQFIFFKGLQCAAYNFKLNRWANGPFSQFFNVMSTGNQGIGVERLCAALVDATKTRNSFRLHGYTAGVLEYFAGSPVDLTTQGNQITLGGPTPLSQEGDWPQMDLSPKAKLLPRYREVACSHVFWPSQMTGGTDELTLAMLVTDAMPPENSSTCNCTFINTTTFISLSPMWQGWNDTWEVDAATRVDSTMISTS